MRAQLPGCPRGSLCPAPSAGGSLHTGQSQVLALLMPQAQQQNLHVLPVPSSPGQGAAVTVLSLTAIPCAERAHKGSKSLFPAIQPLGPLTLPSHLSGYYNSGEELCLKHQTLNSAEMSKQINKLT